MIVIVAGHLTKKKTDIQIKEKNNFAEVSSTNANAQIVTFIKNLYN